MSIKDLNTKCLRELPCVGNSFLQETVVVLC